MTFNQYCVCYIILGGILLGLCLAYINIQKNRHRERMASMIRNGRERCEVEKKMVRILKDIVRTINHSLDNIREYGNINNNNKKKIYSIIIRKVYDVVYSYDSIPTGILPLMTEQNITKLIDLLLSISKEKNKYKLCVKLKGSGSNYCKVKEIYINDEY